MVAMVKQFKSSILSKIISYIIVFVSLILWLGSIKLILSNNNRDFLILAGVLFFPVFVFGLLWELINRRIIFYEDKLGIFIGYKMFYFPYKGINKVNSRINRIDIYVNSKRIYSISKYQYDKCKDIEELLNAKISQPLYWSSEK